MSTFFLPLHEYLSRIGKKCFQRQRTCGYRQEQDAVEHFVKTLGNLLVCLKVFCFILNSKSAYQLQKNSGKGLLKSHTSPWKVMVLKLRCYCPVIGLRMFSGSHTAIFSVNPHSCSEAQVSPGQNNSKEYSKQIRRNQYMFTEWRSLCQPRRFSNSWKRTERFSIFCSVFHREEM